MKKITTYIAFAIFIIVLFTAVDIIQKSLSNAGWNFVLSETALGADSCTIIPHSTNIHVNPNPVKVNQSVSIKTDNIPECPTSGISASCEWRWTGSVNGTTTNKPTGEFYTSFSSTGTKNVCVEVWSSIPGICSGNFVEVAYACTSFTVTGSTPTPTPTTTITPTPTVTVTPTPTVTVTPTPTVTITPTPTVTVTPTPTTPVNSCIPPGISTIPIYYSPSPLYVTQTGTFDTSDFVDCYSSSDLCEWRWSGDINNVYSNIKPNGQITYSFSSGGVKNIYVGVWKRMSPPYCPPDQYYQVATGYLQFSVAGETPTTTPTPTVTITPTPTSYVTPSCSLNVSPSSVRNGNYGHLTWSSSNATSCTAYGSSQFSGIVSTSGSTFVNPSSSTSYSLTCSGVGGSAICSTTLGITYVTPTPTPTTTFKPTPTPTVLSEFTCQPLSPSQPTETSNYFFLGSLVDKIKGIHISWCSFISFLDLVLLFILAWMFLKRADEKSVKNSQNSPLLFSNIQGAQVNKESKWKRFWKWIAAAILAIVLFPKKLWKKFQAWRLKRWAAKMSTISALVAKESQKDSTTI